MTSETCPPTAPAGMLADRPVRWRLVIPVKHADTAKSRLDPPAPLERPELARAVALDTLEAACAALPPHQVTVVTSDPVTTAAALALGARVVADPGRGLDAAVAAGWAGRCADAARTDRADGAVGGWAALLGDLPSLRATDLVRALTACAAHPAAVVPDAAGTGTVLLTSTVGPPTPRFGPGSAARHAEAAVLLALTLPRLRRDVDVAAELEEAVRLGVGRHTTLALELRA
ncbi:MULTISPECIES: 2-phospho-L-lactate guanylyltransferase [unclassified Ornithinimicrobium]|uniref:2-phospho-L-lactate guanylyltransferase n=1 Tax=unclassified Ornithinimicrobium TaxID=2615080 RepID=UPI0038536517